MDDSVGILISFPLDLLLNVFWIVAGKAVRLKLEIIVEFSQVLDEIVHCLRLLLLLGERYLQNFTYHTIDILSWVVCILQLLLDDQAC